MRRITLNVGPALLFAALVFYLSAQSRLPVSLPLLPHVDKVAHACEYAVFAVLVARAVSAYGVARWRLWAVTVLICSLYGASDELHQLFVPGRDADPVDWVVDTVGSAIGAFAWLVATRSVPGGRRVEEGR